MFLPNMRLLSLFLLVFMLLSPFRLVIVSPSSRYCVAKHEAFLVSSLLVLLFQLYQIWVSIGIAYVPFHVQLLQTQIAIADLLINNLTQNQKIMRL